MWFVYNIMYGSLNHMTEQIVKAKFTFTSYKFKIEKAVSFTNVSICKAPRQIANSKSILFPGY